jgi:hypothetical protein
MTLLNGLIMAVVDRVAVRGRAAEASIGGYLEEQCATIFLSAEAGGKRH